MPTPKFVCGAECGIAAVGTLSAGTEHWSTVTGTPTVVTSGPSPMRSTRAFRFNTGFPSMTHLFAAAIASPATAVARFYVYFTSLPAADYTLFQFSGGTTVSGSVRFVASGATLRARAVNTNAASGIAVTTGVWYRVDIKSVNAATQTCDISVDGTAGAQASVASTAQTVLGFQVGDSGVTAPDHYIDDLIVSGTSADYPIGAGTVVGLYPNGDRTNSVASGAGNNGHQFSATTDFGKGTGGATATGAQNVESTSWQSLDNPLTTTASGSWVSNLLGSVGEILVWTMDDLPADATSVNGVMLVATTHSAAATANDFGSLSPFSTGGSQVTPLPITGDMSETTITVPVALMPLGPASAAWTVANVNSCNTAWGSSSDVNPDVYLDGFCWEVDYVPTPPVTGVPPARRDVRQAIQRGSFY